MFEPKLGVSLHTICDELTDEAIDILARSKVETFETKIRQFTGEQGQARTEAFAQMLAASGKRLESIHIECDTDLELSSANETTRQAAMDEAYACIQLAETLGARVLVAHPSDEPVGDDERESRLAQSQQSLAELGKTCREKGLKLAVELLPRTCLAHTADEALKIIAPLDAEVFGICLDTNHLMDRYRTLPDVVRQLGENLIALHVSDHPGGDEKHILPGEGSLAWPAFLAALREIDYPGPLNYECRWRHVPELADRIRILEKNFAWLSGL